MLRRTFLQNAVSAGAALAQTTAPPSATGIRLGFDTYSLRAWRWKAIQLLDFAAAQKLDTVQISSLDDLETLDAPYLQKVKDYAARLHIAIDGGIGCICPTTKSWNPKYGTPQQYIQRGLEVARALGAPSIRCFMGSSEDRLGPLPIEAHMEKTIEVLRSVRRQVLDSGIKIALENHAGDMQAREVRTIIEQAGKDFVGSCLDTGNPMWVAEDPQVALEVLGPYVLTTHIRDSAVYEHPRGAAAQWVALGDGNIDFPAFFALYRKLCPQAAVQLEIITGRPPRVIPYLEREFWKAFPAANAAEFARFVALARGGRPFSKFMIVADGLPQPPREFTDALRIQQQRDLERSVDCAKNSLGLGVNWRRV